MRELLELAGLSIEACEDTNWQNIRTTVVTAEIKTHVVLFEHEAGRLTVSKQELLKLLKKLEED